ncbi:MAG: IclR family transcriptional regulator C-terminal domain-containing protein, partial [Pseudomonadota bacterium]|nr:IclR family transcriptional regulator C-terminal domain-containing protein [Pseudomonadota bacterium]
RIQAYYQQFTQELAQVGFANNLDEFTQQMRKIKKQGFYLSQGEIDPLVCGLSVPIRFSNKEAPIALTLVASKNRFDFLNIQKLIEILQNNAAQIEHKFATLSENQIN